VLSFFQTYAGSAMRWLSEPLKARNPGAINVRRLRIRNPSETEAAALSCEAQPPHSSLSGA